MGGPRTWRRLVFLLLPLALIGWRWLTDDIDPVGLQANVPRLAAWSWLESSKAYLYLHLITLLPVLALSFDRKVHYYRKWTFLWPALLLVGAPFLVWDVYFTAIGVWGFNEEYLLGARVFHLPVEEWLFFVSVPFASVFIYECLRCYFPRDPLLRWEGVLTPALTGLVFLIALWRWQHLYTWTTFIALGFLLLYHLRFGPAAVRSRFYQAYALTLIPFFLINGVLTGGYTRAPIVLYNPGEYLGWRWASIPYDDVAYGFLLVFGNVALYAYFRKKKGGK